MPRLEFPATALARVPSGLAPDQLLKQEVRNEDIVLRVLYPPIEAPEPGFPSDTLQLLIDDQLVGDKVELAAFGTEDIIEIVLRALDRPLDTLVDRRLVKINYRVTYESGTGDTEDGPSDQSFITDIIPPGQNSIGELTFDPGVITRGVTPDDLIDDGAGNRYLRAIVSGYSTAAIGDWVRGRIDDSGDLLSDFHEVGSVGEDIELRFYEDVLLAVDGGSHAFSYLVADRANNVSRLAKSISLDIRLTDRIGDLAAPQIPLFSDDGVIGDADARAPVYVDIPTYARVRVGDRIVVDWGGTPLPPVTIDDPGASPVLISVPVSYGTLQRDPPRYTADVSYTVFRGDDEKTSPPLRDVLVDLSLPGGPGGLDQGIFPEANDNNAINREAAGSEGGTPFVIPVYANQRLGDVIHMSFVKYPNQTGSGEPVEATRYEAEHTVRDDDFDKPFEGFSIPTEYLMMPAGSKLAHSARASYSVTAGSIHVESKSTFVLIDVR